MSVLEAAIGWLAPPDCVGCGREGSALCMACSTSGIIPFGARCWRCSRLSQNNKICQSCRYVGGPRRVWITASYDGLAKSLVSKYKFSHQRIASVPIAELMSQTISSQGYLEVLRSENYLVVPIPTATNRMRQRSFGHAELLAKRVAWQLRLEFYPALRRIGQARQVGAARKERLTQLNNSYVIKQHNKIADRNILLIDDVITTGGTIIAATHALRAAGVNQVYALVFSKRMI